MANLAELMPVLVSGTPLSINLLKEGWPQLSFTEKVEILSILWPKDASTPSRPMSDHSHHTLLDLTLADPNPIVRRIGAMRVHEPSPSYPEDLAAQVARFNRVKSDPVDSVRDHWAENKWAEWRSPGEDENAYRTFWGMPQYYRLLVTHGQNSEKWMAGVISFAIDESIPNGMATLEEAGDVLFQFFTWRDYREMVSRKFENDDPRLGWPVYKDTDECGALWGLLAKATGPMRWTLLHFLTEHGCPPRVLDTLTDSEIDHLLWREDFSPGRYGLRTSYLKDLKGQLRASALHVKSFTIEDFDLEAYFPVPNEDPSRRKQKFRDLEILEDAYAGATIVQLVAINQARNDYRSEWWVATGNDQTPLLARRLAARVESLPYSQLATESMEVRLFLLAHSVTRESYPEELPKGMANALGTDVSQIIEPGNPWRTYFNLKEKYLRRHSQWLESQLPIIRGESWDLLTCIPLNLRGQKKNQNNDGPTDLRSLVGPEMNTLQDPERTVVAALTEELSVVQQELAAVSNKVMLVDQRMVSLASHLRTLVWWVLIISAASLLFRFYR